MIDEIRELFDKIASQRKSLLDVLSSISDKEATIKPNDKGTGEEGDGWSVKQQIAHLIHAEPTWIEWADSILTNPGAVVGQEPVEDGDSQIFLNDLDIANEHPLEFWVDKLNQNRLDNINLIESMNLDSQEKILSSGNHRIFGDMNVIQFLRAIYRHDRMHLDQILGNEQSFILKRRT
jgi:uncharacterized damage-inducible protein DinB